MKLSTKYTDIEQKNFKQNYKYRSNFYCTLLYKNISAYMKQ